MVDGSAMSYIVLPFCPAKSIAHLLWAELYFLYTVLCVKDIHIVVHIGHKNYHYICIFYYILRPNDHKFLLVLSP